MLFLFIQWGEADQIQHPEMQKKDDNCRKQNDTKHRSTQELIPYTYKWAVPHTRDGPGKGWIAMPEILKVPRRWQWVKGEGAETDLGILKDFKESKAGQGHLIANEKQLHLMKTRNILWEHEQRILLLERKRQHHKQNLLNPRRPSRAALYTAVLHRRAARVGLLESSHSCGTGTQSWWRAVRLWHSMT